MMYTLSYMESNGQNFLSFWTIFLALKDSLWDIIITHMCTINDNHMTDLSWDTERDRQNFLSFWTILCIFIPPNNPKNQHFEKMEKNPPGDIIILHMCTINDDNYMMHDSWNMKRDNRIFCHFGPFFALLPPLTTQKIKILENWKKLLEISSFTQVYQKSWSYMLYCSLDITCNKFNYFPFWAIFCPFTSLTTQKIKILKKWKKRMEISFYTSVPKIMIICYTVPET